MHRVIYIVVEADDVQHAVERAETVFKDHLHRDGEKNHKHTTYDYCKPMTSGETVAGSDRWTQFADEPLAASLDTEQAAEWVADARERILARPIMMFARAVLDLEEDGVGIDQLVDLAERADSHSGAHEVAHDFVDSHRHTAEDISDSFARYYFSKMAEGDRMEAPLFDNRRYDEDTIFVVDSTHYFDLFEDDKTPPDERSWVVPLDVHH